MKEYYIEVLSAVDSLDLSKFAHIKELHLLSRFKRPYFQPWLSETADSIANPSKPGTTSAETTTYTQRTADANSEYW